MSIETSLMSKPNLIVSNMAKNLIGSEILKIAAEINEKIKKGEKIYNLTIGDFDPKIFPIPKELNDEIIAAYNAGHTNYPAANGILELRQAVAEFLLEQEGLHYNADEVLIAGGARPLIYSIYQTILDKGETVIFPVPSWNNNHYCHLSSAKAVFVETKASNNFMPTTNDLYPYIKDASLLALCSPLNPTGTVFSKQGLEEICDLVIDENNKRGVNQKPLYLLYDQIYWMLTFGNTKHYNPVSLRPELKNYTVFVDGLSKSLAATGIRVGWGFGPQTIIEKMKSIVGHVGAWAPKAEQVASARFINNRSSFFNFLNTFKKNIDKRLKAFFDGFMSLKAEGYNVDSISPQAAIYLTVKIDLRGLKTSEGKILRNSKDVTSYILEEAKIGIVPFYAFGSSEDSTWYRISVGTCTYEGIGGIINNLRSALKKLS